MGRPRAGGTLPGVVGILREGLTASAPSPARPLLPATLSRRRTTTPAQKGGSCGCAMRTAAGDELHAGSAVVLQGLAQRADLNGRVGTVVEVDFLATGRCKVDLGGSLKPVRVKIANLDVVADPEAAKAAAEAEDARKARLWDSMPESEVEALLARVTPLKEDANRLFRAGDIRGALEQYMACVAELPEPPPWRTLEASGPVPLRKILCAVGGNIAQCHIKLAQLAEEDTQLTPTELVRDRTLWDPAEALSAVDMALNAAGMDAERLRTEATDPTVWWTHARGSIYTPWQMKPLYRRSKIYSRLLDAANALHDLRDLSKLLANFMETYEEHEEQTPREEYTEALKLLKTTKEDTKRIQKYSHKLLQVCGSKQSPSAGGGAGELAHMAALALLGGADPNADDGAGTPLFRAVSCGHDHMTLPYPGIRTNWLPGEETRLLKVLLAAKAGPNQHMSTHGGDTCALCRLSEMGLAPHLVETLVDAGANTEEMCGESNGEGAFTPLIIASQSGHVSTCAALLKSGANVNARRSGSGLTPLHGACENNHPQLVPTLLEAGAELEVCKRAGSQQTAFLISAGKGWVECLRLLIDAGSDMDATFVYQGQTYTALQDAADEFSRGTGPANCGWDDCIRCGKRFFLSAAFPMFVPSLSWQNDRFYILMAHKSRFLQAHLQPHRGCGGASGAAAPRLRFQHLQAARRGERGLPGPAAAGRRRGRSTRPDRGGSATVARGRSNAAAAESPARDGARSTDLYGGAQAAEGAGGRGLALVAAAGQSVAEAAEDAACPLSLKELHTVHNLLARRSRSSSDGWFVHSLCDTLKC